MRDWPVGSCKRPGRRAGGELVAWLLRHRSLCRRVFRGNTGSAPPTGNAVGSRNAARARLSRGSTIKLGMLVALMSVLDCAYAAPGLGQGAGEWMEVRGAGEVRDLYSNKTLEGRVGSNSFVGHYSADGRGILLMNGARLARTWAVKGEDQICVTHERGTDCFTFERNRKNLSEIIGRHVSQPWSFTATIKNGIPKF